MRRCSSQVCELGVPKAARPYGLLPVGARFRLLRPDGSPYPATVLVKERIDADEISKFGWQAMQNARSVSTRRILSALVGYWTLVIPVPDGNEPQTTR